MCVKLRKGESVYQKKEAVKVGVVKIEISRRGIF
jgi:hypothetical protein